MKLQIAIDLVYSGTAVRMVDQIHDIIDIVEVGTPMIIREGLLTVRLLKEKYPDLTVLADTKIVDGGDIESGDACDAGADIVTVLAVSDDATIKAATEAAHTRGKKIMADMICIEDVAGRAVQLDDLGVDYICVHTAVDVQNTGKNPLNELAAITAVTKRAKTAAAGGISMKTIRQIKDIGPEVVVAGGALTKAPDLRAAVEEMLAVLKA